MWGKYEETLIALIVLLGVFLAIGCAGEEERLGSRTPAEEVEM